MSAPDPWWWDAACHGTAPLFDAAPDGLPRGRNSRAQRKADADRFEAAAAICARCPVRRQCTADAEIGRDEGIRAGRLLPSLDDVRKERWSA